MDPSHGIRSSIPQAPWVLYFDGASRKPAGHAGFGVVLKNSKGQTVQEVRKFLGGGVSSTMANYKALIAGLKEAKSLQVKHLLAKGNSRFFINQVVGRWTVRDAHLRDQLKKVWVISKEFDSLLMEFIPSDQNLHADRIAHAAIDNELQIQEVVTEYFDRSGAWPAPHEPQAHKPSAPVSPPARALSPFSNPKLRQAVSPLSRRQPLTINKAITTTAGANLPASPALRPPRGANLLSQATVTHKVSDSDLARTIKALQCPNSAATDRFWHHDPDRLSISDESSTSESEDSEGYFKKLLASNSELSPENRHVAAATMLTALASDEDTDHEDDSSEDEEGFSRCVPSSHRLCNGASANASARSGVQLSKADYDRLVTAVIHRLKKAKLPHK